MHLKKSNDRGFTLIELMVAMVIALIVIASIYQTYQTQQKAFTTQQLVVDMQQNARSAMSLMKREIRMAGYKPAASDGIDNDGDGNIDGKDDDDENGLKEDWEVGIEQADWDQIRFRMDIDSDGLPDDRDEDISYALQANAAGNGNDLVRIMRFVDPPGSGFVKTEIKILAYDIEAIAFGYAFDEDENGTLDMDSDDPPNIIWAYDSGSGNLDKDAQTGVAVAGPPLIGANGPYIGAVRIWLLARTSHPIRGEVDTHTYPVGDRDYGPPGSGADVTYDPAYRRTLQVATVYCRNMRFLEDE